MSNEIDLPEIKESMEASSKRRDSMIHIKSTVNQILKQEYDTKGRKMTSSLSSNHIIKPKMVKTINGKETPFYSKNIFSQNCKLPSLARNQSHKFFYDYFEKEKKSKLTVPTIKKTPRVTRFTPNNQIRS